MSGSMTGWGKYKARELNVEIRGLNSKYKEIFLHLPQELFYMESYVYKIINERITRGRVDIYISFNQEKIKKKYIINESLFEEIYNKIQNKFKKLKINQNLPVEYILRDVEGVTAVQLSCSNSKFSIKKIKKSVICALDDFEKSKKNEGQRLIRDIKKYLLKIEKLVGKLKKQFLIFRKIYAEKARRKIKELFEKDRDKRILDINVIEILEKYEISEELTRLASHIKELMFMIKGNYSGRKIDFFAQEIYREANTVTSKIQDSKITATAIFIKELTEKIREQAQNLE